jgi:hypothetical protein
MCAGLLAMLVKEVHEFYLENSKLIPIFILTNVSSNSRAHKRQPGER